MRQPLRAFTPPLEDHPRFPTPSPPPHLVCRKGGLFVSGQPSLEVSRGEPQHSLWCAVPVVELQCESPSAAATGDDVVNRRAKVPHPNTVEDVAAGHLAGDVGFKGGHLTCARARTVERYRGRRPGTAVGDSASVPTPRVETSRACASRLSIGSVSLSPSQRRGRPWLPPAAEPLRRIAISGQGSLRAVRRAQMRQSIVVPARGALSATVRRHG
jgi:hypothetical protein